MAAASMLLAALPANASAPPDHEVGVVTDDAPTDPVEPDGGRSPRSAADLDVGLRSVNPTDTSVNNMSFFAYVDAGESLDVVFERVLASGGIGGATITVDGPDAGPFSCTIAATAGAPPCTLAGLTSAVPGVWHIQVAGTVSNNGFSWDIDVRDGATSIDGRVWTEFYNMRQSVADGFPDFSFWYQTEHGYLYRATYGGFNGINSIFTADATGVRYNDTCTSAYASIVVSTQVGETPDTERSVPGLGECGDPYKIFFDPPAADLPASADRWDGGSDWIVPAIVDPTITSVTFTSDSTAIRSGTIEYEVASFTGQLTIEIDTDDDGTFDVAMPGSAVAGAGSVYFDGLDGNGDPVSAFQDVTIRASITQVGEIHFMNRDVEVRSGGLEVIRLNGPDPGDATLYWNDTDLSTSHPCGNWGGPLDGRSGIDSTGGVHWWDAEGCGGIAGGWGDARVIDDWTFVPVDESMQIDVAGDVQPPFECTADGILLQYPGAVPPTQVQLVDLVTGDVAVGATLLDGRTINGAAYNVVDDYLYGWDHELVDGGPDRVGIVRVGGDGSVEELGVPDHPELDPTSSWPVGDIDDNGHYWVANAVGSSAVARWYQIDLNTSPPVVLAWGDVAGNPTGIAQGSFTGSGDWAWVPGGGDNLWRVMRDTATDNWHLIRFDRSSGTHHDMGELPALNAQGISTFGAVFADEQFLYVSNNTSGDIFRVDVQALTASFFTGGPSSNNNDGARCAIAPIFTDYGDAPASYGTLLDDDGPRHGLREYDPDANTAPLMLGTQVSHEIDGQPSVGADADTFDDGVAAPIVMVIGQSTEVEVVVTNNTDQPATLAGWIDLDDDGTFDPSELQWTVIPANAGTTTVTLTFPLVGTPGDGTYARFRLFPGEVAEAELLPTGPASAGEVEDYPVVGPVAILLQCPNVYAQQGGSPYNIYEVDTSTGEMTVVGQFSAGTGTNNGLGISADARYLFGHRNGEVLRYDTFTGENDTFPGVAGLNSTHGGVDPTSGIYYYGNTTSVYAFDPATETSLGQIASLSYDIAPPGANGDWSFDAQGNMYLVAGSATSSGLYVVGGLPTAAVPTPVSVTGSQITTFGTSGAAVNGIAFDATGSLFAASNAVIFEIDPSTGDVLATESLSPSGVSVDLASCSTPPSILLQKDIVDRFDDGDQFQVTITGGGISQNNVGITSGSGTGLQTGSDAVAGPVLGRPGETYDIAESGASGADLAHYDIAWECVNATDGGAVVASGTGESGSFEMPDTIDGIGAAIVCTITNTPLEVDIGVAKSSDPEDGSDVQPGDVVTYTVVVSNDGQVGATPTIVDDLSGVLDDAFYNDDVVATVGTATIVGSTLEWSGTLAPGEFAIITYSVTVAPFPGAQTTEITVLDTADVNTGDGWMVTSYVLDPGCATLNGPAAALPYEAIWGDVHAWFGSAIAPRADQHIGGAGCYPGGWTGYDTAPNRWVLTKSFTAPADGLATVLADGFRGDGGARVRVNGVDAGLYGQWNQPAVDGTVQIPVTEGPNTIEIEVRDVGGANMVQGRLDVSMVGPLGDGVMSNVVTGGQCPDPAITDPDDPAYDPDCHNTVYVRDYRVNKSATPSDPVPGDTVTYTIDVTNTGEVDYTADAPATVVDDLSGVLDDAVYNADVSVDPAGAGTVTYTEPALSWEGPLLAGDTVTITYTVTVNGPGELGDGVMLNSVVGGQCPDPAITDPADPGFDPGCVEILRVPDHRVVKSSVPATGEMVTAGGLVTYTITVENTGGLPYTAGSPAVVTDDLSDVLDDASYNDDASAPSGDVDYDEPELVWSGPLPVGESVAITYSVTVNAVDDLGDGVLANVVAGGQCPDPAITDPSDPDYDPDCHNVVTVATPSIEIDKSSDVSDAELGDVITYTFVATNTGNVTLTDVTISDPMPGLSALDCDPGQPAVLAPLATMECSATYTVTQADVDSGAVVNSAIATGTPPDGPPVDDEDEEETPTPHDPAISLVKSADPLDQLPDLDEEITYTFVVTNTGNVTLTDVGVTDVLVGLSPIVCDPSDTTLAPGDQIICTATYTVTQDDIDTGIVENVATATGTPPDGPDVEDEDEQEVPAEHDPSISLVKSSDVSDADVGDVITYTFVATNTGNVTLTDVTVSDPMPGLSALTCNVAQPATVAPGQFLECTATYAVTQADVDSGSVVNSATATGTPPDGPPVDDEDEEEIPTPQFPAIEIDKSSDVTDAELGDVITYTFVATNTGNVTLTDVSVTDPMPGLSALDCDPGQPAVLAPGDELECSATYTVTQADVDSGSVVNSAIATGTPPDGPPVDDEDEEETPTPQFPAIAIDKSSDVSDADVGDVVTYTFVATNTGNVTLTGVVITDPMPGLSALECTPGQPAVLAPTESMECSATYTVTQADVDSGSVVNSATATGTPPDGPPVDDDDEDEIPTPQFPAIAIDKSSDVSDADVGDVVTYTFVATNTGNVTLTDVSISDPMPGLSALACNLTQPATIAPGQFLECTATYTVTQADVDSGSVVNSATATGTPPDGPLVDDEDEEETPTPHHPSISLVKSAEPVYELPPVGEDITYTFVVTNTGNVTLTDVGVTDELVGLSAIVCDPSETTLAPGEQLVCTATYTVTQDDIDAEAVENRATATGTPPDGPPVDDDDEVEVPSPHDPGLQIVKTSNVSDAEVGDVITYTFVATNTGNVTLTGVTIADPKPGLSSLSCATPMPATLAPGAVLSCTATYTVTQPDVNSGSVTNTATVTGTPPVGPPIEEDDDDEVPTPRHPGISLTKTPNATSAGLGDAVTYTFVATNTGNVTLTDVSITDPMPGLSALECMPAQPTSLAPGSSLTCTATYTVTQADVDAGSVSNEASVTGRPPSGPTIGDDDDAVVSMPQNPGVSLVKASNVSSAQPGQTITYSFAVTNTGNVTLTDVVLDDPMLNGSVAVCEWATIAPGQTVSCSVPYVVAASDAGGDLVNEATVTAGNLTVSSPPVSDGDVDTIEIVSPPTPPAPVPPTPDPPDPELPATGAALADVLKAALLLSALGWGLWFTAHVRRRSRAAAS